MIKNICFLIDYSQLFVQIWQAEGDDGRTQGPPGEIITYY